MSTDLFMMSDEEYERWFFENTGLTAAEVDLSEEGLVRLLSNAMRALEPDDKANYFLQLANLAMAMADKTLGSQNLVTTSVLFQKH